jgi:hypothetical protein
MRRSALRTFFERVIVATLPLAAAACDNPATPPDMAAQADLGGVGGGGGEDLAVPTGDLADPNAQDDLPAPPDMTDVCELMFPVTYVPIAKNLVPDAGHFNTLCVVGDPCTTVCPTGYTQCCSPHTVDMGPTGWEVSCVYNCGPAGRRPEGLAAADVADGCESGRYFAEMAHLEAASVHAFRALGRELSAHGAPAHLVALARKAARDEIRHARATRRLAQAHGATVPPVRVGAPRVRALEEIAVENAAEGCVRETYGALLAGWQARTAADPSVRALMASIADDETRHAELAWAVDAWTRTRLDRTARRRVVAARRREAAKLRDELSAPPPPSLARRIGLPDAHAAQQLLGALDGELWG